MITEIGRWASSDIDVDILGAGRAPLCYSVIISHLFLEVGPRYLSNCVAVAVISGAGLR